MLLLPPPMLCARPVIVVLVVVAANTVNGEHDRAIVELRPARTDTAAAKEHIKSGREGIQPGPSSVARPRFSLLVPFLVVAPTSFPGPWHCCLLCSSCCTKIGDVIEKKKKEGGDRSQKSIKNLPPCCPLSSGFFFNPFLYGIHTPQR